MRGIGPITQKEKEVLALIAELHTYQDIATILGIEVSTVYQHVNSIMTKVDVHKHSHLIRYAIEHGYGKQVPA